MIEDQIEVSEIFSSIQGEGPDSGKLSLFIRLRRCPLACSWCDTKYTWDKDNPGYQDYQSYAPGDLEQVILQNPSGRVVLTGGEPLLWSRYIPELIYSFIFDYGGFVEFETAGVVPPIKELHGWPGMRYNVSPKLAHSGNADRNRLNLPVLRKFAYGESSCFKFVCRVPSDLHEVGKIQGSTGIKSEQVWIMPEGTNSRQLLRRGKALIGPVMQKGYNFSQRQHIFLFGDKKGT